MPAAASVSQEGHGGEVRLRGHLPGLLRRGGEGRPHAPRIGGFGRGVGVGLWGGGGGLGGRCFCFVFGILLSFFCLGDGFVGVEMSILTYHCLIGGGSDWWACLVTTNAQKDFISSYWVPGLSWVCLVSQRNIVFLLGVQVPARARHPSEQDHTKVSSGLLKTCPWQPVPASVQCLERGIYRQTLLPGAQPRALE